MCRCAEDEIRRFLRACGTAMERELSSFLCDDHRESRCGQCHKQHHDQRCTKDYADQAHQNADQKAQYDPCGAPKIIDFPPSEEATKQLTVVCKD